MAISDMLEEELGLYQRLVAEQAARDPEHDQAAKFNVDEVVSLGLFVIDRIRERNRILSEAGHPANFSLMSDSESVYLVRLYQTWLSETRKLIERLLSLERSSIIVAHGNDLIQTFHDVNLICIDAERVKRSMKDAIEGRVKPLREAADEFRRRRYGRSA